MPLHQTASSEYESLHVCYLWSAHVHCGPVQFAPSSDVVKILDIPSLHDVATPGLSTHNQRPVDRHLKTLMDIGDIVGVTGPMKRTDKGELSIVAEDLQVCLS